MIFRAQKAREAVVDREIMSLQRGDADREKMLKSVSEAMIQRAKALDRMVEEMKENRRGQNG